MFQLIDNAVSSLAVRDQLCFEQPLTERMRTFLRLEFLYEQARFHLDGVADYSARATVSSLLEILAILGRGDIRAEVLKELERQSERLKQFHRSPDVDADRLSGFIRRLDALKGQLAAIGTQFLQPLKDCDFLSAIKHRSSIPGGTCTFDIPDYAYWLSSSVEEREEQLGQWLQTLSPLCEAVAELLWLTREASEPESCVAEAGFYQHSLDRNVQLNLVRVQVPQSAGMYPEISAGKHRFTIRFVEWRGVKQRAVQSTKNVSFGLMLS
jgi:cell division protein ZapD